eukprot:TRINITY_DN2642_c0_g1::TRINITY_DN2642_c0_g1_i1::g.26226::m.26226 TRINITY_DN2642_c0_g1::TRINITY_DN2642_c0_g1_i1::g.26226  ORF type:complete len:172 (-),score=47.63 TRINITY_DN2642_c0_g1_i1:363-878(-)
MATMMKKCSCPCDVPAFLKNKWVIGAAAAYVAYRLLLKYEARRVFEMDPIVSGDSAPPKMKGKLACGCTEGQCMCSLLACGCPEGLGCKCTGAPPKCSCPAGMCKCGPACGTAGTCCGPKTDDSKKCPKCGSTGCDCASKAPSCKSCGKTEAACKCANCPKCTSGPCKCKK